MAPDVGFVQRYVGEWILEEFSRSNDESQHLPRLFAKSFDVRVKVQFAVVIHTQVSCCLLSNQELAINVVGKCCCVCSLLDRKSVV